jgi:hypothetical protein
MSGPDRFRLDFGDSATRSSIQIEWQRHYWLDDSPLTKAFSAAMSPRLGDLLDIAMAIYAADRLCRRPPEGSRGEQGWSRRFELRVPVQQPEFWRRRVVKESLTTFLAWLTEDDWSLDFVGLGRRGRRSAVQDFLFSTPPAKPTRVALFSGGLDSLLGVDTELSKGVGGELILVSASSSRRLLGVQRKLIGLIGQQHGGIRSVRVPFNLTANTHPDSHERSQRSRGFVFLVLGGVTADMAGVDELRVYENGVGALNLPYSGAQLGAQSSRAMHPATLNAAGSLLSLVFDRQFLVANPFALRTKGELCRSLSSESYGLINHTVSCDRFPQRVAGRALCGVCTSCLLRRQALWSAGLLRRESSENYRFDVMDSASIADERLFFLDLMQFQARQLQQAADSSEPWTQLVQRFPALARVPNDLTQGTGPLFQTTSREGVIAMLKRYGAEWAAFGQTIAETNRSASGGTNLTRRGAA